jgi:excisionase family DNA binding protein
MFSDLVRFILDYCGLMYNRCGMAKDLKVEEVAEHLRVTKQTVRNWLNRGDLDGYQLGVGGEWRVTKEALARFLGVALSDFDPE